MTGNADADDLREIDSKFSKIDDFNEDLKQRNNEQADINRIFEDSINDLTKTISNSISLKFNQTFNSLDIINLMFNIQIIENKLEKLSEAIIISKLKLAAKGILNESELELIESKLKEQILKFTSYDEMLLFVQAEIEYFDEIFYYHVNIPIVERGYQRIFLEPLNKDKKEIKIEFQDVLIKQNKTLAIVSNCLEVTDTICSPNQMRDISDDACINKLTRDLPGNCIFKNVEPKSEIKIIADGKIIVKNFPETKFFSTCGIGNHTIIGSLFISFVNCSITINGQTFENSEIKIKNVTELMPSFEMTIKRRGLEPDLHELHEIHIKNIDRFNQLHQQHQHNWKTTINISFIVISSSPSLLQR